METNKNWRFVRHSRLRARACQLTAGHMSICPQIEVNNHPASLGVIYGQHLKSPNCYLLSTTTVIIKNQYLPNSSQCWDGHPSGREPVLHQKYKFKVANLKLYEKEVGKLKGTVLTEMLAFSNF